MSLNIDMEKKVEYIMDSLFSQLDDFYGDDPDDIRWDQQEGALVETCEACEDFQELYENNGWGSISDMTYSDELSEDRKKEIISTFIEIITSKM